MTPEPTPSQELDTRELARQLHSWYLEVTKLLDPKAYNKKAQKPYDELTGEQQAIDGYIAERLIEYFKQHELSRKQEWVEAQEKYDELIMAVGNKYAGETRHETALRYIKSCENNYETRAKTIKEQSKALRGVK